MDIEVGIPRAETCCQERIEVESYSCDAVSYCTSVPRSSSSSLIYKVDSSALVNTNF